MKNKFLKYSLYSLAAAGTLVGLVACDRDDVAGLQEATLPTTSAVYIDGFSAGMGYAAYGGSKVTAFETDNEVKYEGTSSMRFDIPNSGDPESAWAGGFFYSDPGRDFSGYNCVTFYAKASAGASVDQLGYGVGPDGTTYQAYAADVNVGTAWQKYIIPIADASKLTDAKGLFYFIDTPDDGNGYSFWLDNVQYEDLGTIGHKEAQIFGGKDSISSAGLTGTTYQVSGLGATFNTGAVKQNLILSSNYFTFASSDEAVATVSETGLVTLVGEGTAIITAKLGEDDATGSLTVKSSGGIEPAPVPTVEADKVVSMFSDAYTNVEGINWFTYWQYSTGDANLLTIGDANYMQFDNVNFWGVESTTNLIDATDMTHFHMDVMFPDGSNDKGLVINIIDFGTDGAYGGATDYTGSITFPASTFTAGEWASLDIDLSQLAGLATRSNIAQLVFVCDPDGQTLPTFLMDNAYFYQGEGGGTGEPGADPTAAATAPTADAASVKSIFSDAYTAAAGMTFQQWGSTTEFSDVVVGGDTFKKMATMTYFGMELDAITDFSDMTHLHVDVYTTDDVTPNIALVNSAAATGGDPAEASKSLGTLAKGQWVSFDIPLSDFSGVDLAKIDQMKMDNGNSATIYMDNLYFHSDGGNTGGNTGDAPTAAATAPTHDAGKVKSLFSDAYTPFVAADFNPESAQAQNDAALVTIDGSEVWKFENLVFFMSTWQSLGTKDFSDMETLHLDVWTPDANAIRVMLQSNSTGAKDYTFSDLTPNTWNSLEIPLASLTGLDLSDLIFMQVFDQSTTGTGHTVFVDNVYFYTTQDGGNTGGNTGGDPTAAATAPTQDAGNVQSVFSDAYTAAVGVTFQQWGAPSTFSDITVGGDTFKKIADMTYFGMELASATDFSSATHVHLDVYTNDDVTPNFFLVNSAAATGGDAVEASKALTLTAGQWTSFDIPLSEFGAIDFSKIDQMKMDGGNSKTIYLDNLYFYNADGGNTGGNTGDAPTAAATAPTHEAAKVKSLFSDTYTAFVNADFDSAGAQAQNDATLMTIDGSEVWKYENLVFFMPSWQDQGAKDFSDMEKLHLDVWTPDANAIRVMLQSNSTGAKDVTFSDLTPNAWNSLEITLSDLAGLDLSDLIFMQVFDQSTNGTGHTVFVDNVYFYTTQGGGNTGGTTSSLTTPAPTPTVEAAKVKAIYSDSYTAFSGTNFNASWGQSTVMTEESVSGNNVLHLATLNYQGFELSGAQDVSSCNMLHIDIWTNDATLIKVTPISPGSENGTDVGTINHGQWNSYDIPLTTFTEYGVDLSQIIQFKIDAQAGVNPCDIYIDNLYFYDAGTIADETPASELTVAAAAPTRDAAMVKSIFSDEYDVFVGTQFDGAGNSCVAEKQQINGNYIWKWSSLNFGFATWQSQGPKTVSDMENLHLDIYTPDADKIRILLQSNSSAPGDFTVDVAQNTWNSIDIPMSEFKAKGLNPSDVIFIQIFDQSTTGTGHTIYMDNIYFYRSTTAQTYTPPTTAAPVPTKAAADVISIFSDSYTTVAGINYNPNWGQSTQVDATTNVGGNAYLSYTNLNYQGTEFSDIDVSGMTHLHVDVWTTNDDAIVKITPIAKDSAVGEHLVELTGVTPGQWTSIDIPLSTYTNANMTLNKVFQMKVDAASGTNPTDVYFDNIYFHK